MRLKDKAALVSGAARGMGYEIVEPFAREGAITYAGDIDLALRLGQVARAPRPATPPRCRGA